MAYLRRTLFLLLTYNFKLSISIGYVFVVSDQITGRVALQEKIKSRQ